MECKTPEQISVIVEMNEWQYYFLIIVKKLKAIDH